MKKSLPGWYSHLSRMFVFTASLAELYCTSAPTNMRGVSVKLARLESSVVVKLPCARSIQLTETRGSSESFGVTSTRPK